MTEPDDLVELEVPAEQLREGDLLEHEEQAGALRTVDHTVPDGEVIRVGFLAGDPLPVPRGHLVRVRRPRSSTTLGVTVATIAPEEFTEVRDLALALADLAATATRQTVQRVADHRDRVRNRLEASTDGTAGPDAPVLGLPQPLGEPAPAPPVVAPVVPGAAKGKR